ncbi:hypothetical protein PAAL109150_25955 [Paenibacillus alkaliterrae]
MMKKYTFLLIAMLLCSTAVFNFTASTAPRIDVMVVLDSKNMEFNPRAFLANGTTMVPFRQLFEELGATVSYDEKNAVYKCY